jgi:hypothetical protein
MAQQEEMRVVSKTAAEAPPQETLAGSCGSAAVRAMSLPNDLPGHRQRLGPGEDHCEAEIQASKGLEQAGEGEAQGQGGEAEDQEAERRQRTQAESDWRLRGLLQGEKGAHTDPAGATMCALLFGCSVPS